MGLKQDIIVVNEFSTKTRSGGSRGGTPGDYVLRYMAREGAVEDIAPVRLFDNEDYVLKYMARKEATEVLDNIPDVKNTIHTERKLGGVAFGCKDRFDEGDISMSDRKIRQISKDMQRQFELGKTVFKTVLSFDEEYLRKHKIIEEDFKLERAGDYRGNIDQMRLRAAVMDGVKKLNSSFDNLEWVGVIQVDTKHVHAHLAMVDKGVGNLIELGKYKGQQRGKLNETQKRTLRRGVDMSLDESKEIQLMASNISYDKRNIKCFIKKFTHNVMQEHSFSQFLLSTLPKDKRLWRASTNRKEMRKPNALVREYVEQILTSSDSGFDKAMQEVGNYANERRDREGLNDKEHRQLIENGRERIIEESMNGVYQVLKDIPTSEKEIMTPMLDAMSMDYDEMAREASKLDAEPMVEFGFKLRSYSSRLNHHKKQKNHYKERREAYEDMERKGNVSEDSRPLYLFYKEEEEYNEKLMSKYQHFLKFIPDEEEYEKEFKELMDYRNKLFKMRLMEQDKSMKRMQEKNAEEYGLKTYDQHGGSYMLKDPSVIKFRLNAMELTYKEKEEAFKSHLSDFGLSLEEEGNVIGVKNKPLYEFDDVKALDLHHLGYDFPMGIEVSKINIDNFIEQTDKRYEAFINAKEYLVGTNQLEFINLPEKDVEVMKELADSLKNTTFLASKPVVAGNQKKRSKTVSLDKDLDNEMKLAVKMSVNSTSLMLGV